VRNTISFIVIILGSNMHWIRKHGFGIYVQRKQFTTHRILERKGMDGNVMGISSSRASLAPVELSLVKIIKPSYKNQKIFKHM
jgi:hypothetical protein